MSGKIDSIDSYDPIIKDANAIAQKRDEVIAKGGDLREVAEFIRVKYPEFYESYSVIVKYILAELYDSDVFLRFLKWLNKTIAMVGIQDEDHYMFLQCRYIVFWKRVYDAKYKRKMGDKIAQKIHDTEYERQKEEYRKFKEETEEINRKVEEQKTNLARDQLRGLLNGYSS